MIQSWTRLGNIYIKQCPFRFNTKFICKEAATAIQLLIETPMCLCFRWHGRCRCDSKWHRRGHSLLTHQTIHPNSALRRTVPCRGLCSFSKVSSTSESVFLEQRTLPAHNGLLHVGAGGVTTSHGQDPQLFQPRMTRYSSFHAVGCFGAWVPQEMFLSLLKMAKVCLLVQMVHLQHWANTCPKNSRCFDQHQVLLRTCGDPRKCAGFSILNVDVSRVLIGCQHNFALAPWYTIMSCAELFWMKRRHAFLVLRKMRLTWLNFENRKGIHPLVFVHSKRFWTTRCLRPSSHRTRSTSQQTFSQKGNTLWTMGVFTQLASNIKLSRLVWTGPESSLLLPVCATVVVFLGRWTRCTRDWRPAPSA